MQLFSDMVLLEITDVITVYSKKGERFQMNCRPTFGLSLCKEGKITYTQGKNKVVSDPSCAVLLPQGATYELYRHTDGSFPLINFRAAGLSVKTFQSFALPNAEACMHTFDALRQAFAYEKNQLRAMRYAYQLFDQIQCDTASDFALLKPAEIYLREHLCDSDLRNAQLAQAANISEVYFRRLFTQKYGTAPKRYILSARIELAKQRLVSSRDSIATIAADCGFQDIFHFCRYFHNTVGYTPTEYRKKGVGI